MTKFFYSPKFFLSFLLFPIIISCTKEGEAPTPIQEESGDEKLELYYSLYKNTRNSNQDSALFYLDKLKESAASSNHEKWLGKAYSAKGKILQDQNLLSEAAFHYFEAVKYFKAAKEPLYLADNYEYLGIIFSLANEHLNAIPYKKKALELYKQHAPSEEVARENFNLSTSFLQAKQYEEALHHITEALKIFEENKDLARIRNSYNIIGAIYFKQKDFDKARQYYEKSLAIGQDLSDYEEHKAAILNNIGETYVKEGKLETGKEYLQNALQVKEKLQNPDYTRSTLNLLAEAALLQGDTAVAVNYLEKALANLNPLIFQDEAGASLTTLVTLLGNTSSKALAHNQRFEKLGNYSSLLAINYNKLKELKEELEKLSKQYQLQLAVDKFNSNTAIEKTEEKKKQLTWAIAVPAALIIFSFGLIFYYAIRYMLRLRGLMREYDQKMKGYEKIEQAVNMITSDF